MWVKPWNAEKMSAYLNKRLKYAATTNRVRQIWLYFALQQETPKPAPVVSKDEDEDDALSYFQRLADEWDIGPMRERALRSL